MKTLFLSHDMNKLDYEIRYNPSTNSYRIWDYFNECWDWDAGDYCHLIYETRFKFLAKRRMKRNRWLYDCKESNDSWKQYE